MVCVHCSQDTKVVNSRHQVRTNQVWRRRACLACGAVFTSTEAADYSSTWLVKGKSGLRPFSSDKLFLSLHKSCEHRKTALSDARSLHDTVINKVREQLVDGVINSKQLASTIQVALGRFDKAASSHYAAYHPL